MTLDASVRLLLVDDDDDSRALMARSLRSTGYHIVEAADGAEAIALDLKSFDLVLTDYQMPLRSGREVLDAVRRVSPGTPVIVFTAFPTAQGALDLMGAGAYDYLPRPVDLARLRLVVQRALDWRRLVLENNALRHSGKASGGVPTEPVLVGTSAPMIEVYKVIAQVAPTVAAVLLVGDAGTGKELVARTLHARSGRTGPFVTVHCAALSEAMLSHELFGTEGGSEHGPLPFRRGLFEESAGGTILLDDIDDIPPAVQSRLLQVITDRTVVREGHGHAARSDAQTTARESTRVDVRVLAATRQDMASLVSSGRFREDLLSRLQVVTLQLPPLTARGGDLDLLIDHFTARYAASLGRPVPVLASEARQCLLAYPWPGNVRELAQTLERALVMARGNVIVRENLPPTVVDARRPVRGTDGLESDWPTLSTVERRYIDRVLQHTRGNKTRAAEVLGIDRRTLSRLFARERSAGATPEGFDQPDGDARESTP